MTDPSFSWASNEADALALPLLRSHVYRLFADGFRKPSSSQLSRLQGSYLAQWQHLISLLAEESFFEALLASLRGVLAQAEGEELLASYARLFEAHGGLLVSPYETDHRKDTPQHALAQTYELADIAGFYKAFGLIIAESFPERADHIAVELEFMHLLAAQEAHAIEHGDVEQRQRSLHAQMLFFRDHLGRWIESFARKVCESEISVYAQLAALLMAWASLEKESLASEDVPCLAEQPAPLHA
jgi:TorA maturation chaperone TorD